MAIIANNVIFDVLKACCVSLINEVFLCNKRNCFTFAIQYNFHFLCFHLFPFFLKYHFKGSHSSQTVILNSCHTDRNCSCFTGLLHGKSVSFLVIEHWSSLSGNRDHARFQVSRLLTENCTFNRNLLFVDRAPCRSLDR